MKAAYNNAEIMQDERGEKFIRIDHSTEISPRDAAQYLYLVFIAADKVGMLSGIKGNISPGIVKTGQGEIVAVIIK